MQIHELKREHKRKGKRSVGRGGKRGKTSGRGTKGQKARSGRKIRPQLRDEIMKLPKLRGYRFQSRQEKPVVVDLATIQNFFKDGGQVSPKILLEKGVVSKRSGRMSRVKILSDGEISVKIAVSGCLVSAKAKEKIEKAGGSVSEK